MQNKTLLSKSFIERLSPKILWPCLFAITLLTHASYINNGFAWLDHGDSEQGRAILPLAELHKAPTQPFGETGFYRPLVTIFHSLDAAIYGDWAPGFHLTNVLLHCAAAACAVLYAMAFFSLPIRESLLAALIFAIHPLTWLPVGAISYRPELLAAGLTFLTVYFHLKARESNRTKFVAATSLSFLLALLSKETPLFWIPALIILYEIVKFKKGNAPGKATNQKRIKSVGKKTAPAAKFSKSAGFLFCGEIIVIGIYTTLRITAVPETWHATAISLDPGAAIGTRLHVLGLRFFELLSPLKPAMSDATSIQGLFSISSLMAIALLAGLAALFVRSGFTSTSGRAVAFCAIALAPALNIVPLPRFSSPHYSYFAAIASGVLVVQLFKSSSRWSGALQRLTQTGIGFWLLLAAFSTSSHGARFKNDLALFEPEVAQDRNFLEGQYYLGDYFMKLGDLERAATAYRAALDADPNVLAYVDRSSAMINYAGVLLKQGEPEQTENLLMQVSGNVSTSEQQLIDYNLALIANKRRDFARVVALLEKHQLHWQRPEPLLLLAQALRYLERTNEAVKTLQLALPYLDAQQREKVKVLIEASR